MRDPLPASLLLADGEAGAYGFPDPLRERVARARAAARALLAGGVAIFPTDTVYGIAAHPDHPEALRRVYAIKGRPDGKPVALLAADAEAPARLGAAMPPLARELAAHFWPGPLTLVLDCGGRAEGFRVPDSPLARAIIAAAGGLLRVTSANLSGQPALDEIGPAMEPVCAKCDVVVDGGRCPGGVPSTVVKVAADGTATVLRAGGADVVAALARDLPLA